MSSKEPATYPDFLHYINHHDTFALIPSIVYLWDIQRMKYLYFSKNVLEFTGYAAEDFLAKGPGFAYSLVHPDDVPQVVEQVQKTQLEFLHSLSAGEFASYKFTYNYRIRRADGLYIQILTQETFLQVDANRNPLLSFGIVSDITHLKKDTAITLSISRFDKENNFMRSLYTFGTKESILSAREIQILRLIVDGCKTDEIADKLCLSIHTVKNHRRHMLEKTGTKNLPDLIRYAMKEGLFK